MLTIQGEKLDNCAKARTMHQAKQIMMDHIREDIETRFGGVEAHKVQLDIAHTHNEEEAMKFREEVEKEFPGYQVGFVDPLSLSVSCHIGDGALAPGHHENGRIKSKIRYLLHPEKQAISPGVLL